MTPEAADYLSKARDDLNDARKVAAIGLAKMAARAAYYAAFHAAAKPYGRQRGYSAGTF